MLRGDEQDPDEIAWQATKIGYDNLAGELTGGIGAAVAAGLRTTSTRLLGPDDVSTADASRVLDVRQRNEFVAGHLPGAHNVELGDLTVESPTAGPSGTQLVVMCGHGERALTGASVLERAGHRDVAVLVGGPEDWAAAHGSRLETGE